MKSKQSILHTSFIQQRLCDKLELESVSPLIPLVNMCTHTHTHCMHKDEEDLQHACTESGVCISAVSLYNKVFKKLLYNFELSRKKTGCCRCSDGAGEMFQQDHQDLLFHLCYQFSCPLPGDFLLKNPVANFFPILRPSKNESLKHFLPPQDVVTSSGVPGAPLLLPPPVFGWLGAAVGSSLAGRSGCQKSVPIRRRPASP